MQLKKENGIDLLSIPPVRLGEEEEVTYEVASIAVKKALRLNRAIQAKDGHWPAENAGPMFFTPPLVIISLSGARSVRVGWLQSSASGILAFSIIFPLSSRCSTSNANVVSLWKKISWSSH